MKIAVEIKREYSMDIDLTENILLEIADNYNGNIKKWAKDNYDDFWETRDVIYESFEGIEYNEEEFKKLSDEAVKNRDKILQYQLENRKELELEKLQGDAPSNILDWEETQLDIKALEKASLFVDFNNPKFELNYIHIRNNIIEATDTRKAIQIVSQKDIKAEILFSIAFIDLLKDGAKVFLEPSAKGIVKREAVISYKDKWYYTIDDNFKYPDISRVMNIENYKKVSTDEISYKPAFIQGNKGWIDLIEFKIRENKIYFKRSVMQSIVDNFKPQTVYFENDDSSLVIEDEDIKMAIMPFVVNKDDEISYVKREEK